MKGFTKLQAEEPNKNVRVYYGRSVNGKYFGKVNYIKSYCHNIGHLTVLKSSRYSEHFAY